MLETAESLWKLVSKDRFPKLKDFALKMHSMFGNTCVCESAFSTMKQVKSENRNRLADETLDDSLWLFTSNTSISIDKGTIMSEKSLPQPSLWQRFVIKCYLLLCNNFSDALTYLPFFSFKCCGSVALYIILLEVARELSHFCKMAHSLKVVGPSWPSGRASPGPTPRTSLFERKPCTHFNFHPTMLKLCNLADKQKLISMWFTATEFFYCHCAWSRFVRCR